MTSALALPFSAPLRPVSHSLSLIVIGTGHVGSTVLDQLAYHPQFPVCAIANSRQLLFQPQGIDLGGWRPRLASSPADNSIQTLVEIIAAMDTHDVAVVDCTASGEIVNAYGKFVRAGAHVITPNKKANVLPWEPYRRLLDDFSRNDRQFLYSTNVGAGLPILNTLTDLISSGDTIQKIEGMFSGTLSYLFNHFDGTRPFSALVREAHEQGFTEPDPRNDLSGADVGAKMLVLARQLGWKLDLEDVQVESLLFDPLDGEIDARYRRALQDNCVLRYVATLSDGEAFAELECVPRSHPFANTRHTDNIVAFHTKRYCRSPLVIQGPGAGPEVTAAGVIVDILRLVRPM